ncbi:AMP-binding protein [bacterium]|nr:AMP-binding protein [bacterium]
MIIGQVLEQKAREIPDQPAIIAKEACYTYSDVLRQAASLANSLLDRGLKKGDRVGILTHKSPETVLAYLGMGLAGIVGVPLSFHYRQERLGQVISSTGLKMVLVDPEFLPLLKGFPGHPTDLRLVVTGPRPVSGMISWAELVADSGAQLPGIAVHPDDTFYLNFTSGSTGEPKAVETTHVQIHWNTLSSIEALDIEERARHLCMFAVFSHPHEIFARPLWTGGTMVLLDSLYPKSVATMVSEYRISYIMGLAPMYEMLLPFAQSGRFDFSSLKLVESGGMFTNLDLQKKFIDRFGIAIRPVWGSTETTGVALATGAMTGLTRSCGRAAPYYTVKLIGPQGQEVERGETGEMIIQGPAVVTGYLDDPVETGSCFHEGWFHTGDMVYQDEEDYYYFRGRSSGMMKVGGLKVFPQEIEETIRLLPEVEEVAVVPMPEKLRGEVPHAFVVLKEGELEDQQKIKDFCRSGLPNYMVPKRIDFRPALPRTVTGKVDKNALVSKTDTDSSSTEDEEIRRRLERIDLKILQLLNERTRISLALQGERDQPRAPLFAPGEVEETLNRILGFNSGPLHDEYIERFFRDFLDYLMTL